MLDYRWRDVGLLSKALRHPSFTGNRTMSNQRLEFIGDSVLDLVVGLHLMKTFPDQNEGFLAETRSSLVNEEALANRGRALGLHELVQVQTKGARLRQLDSTAAQCVEAVIGAAFIDSSFDFMVALRVVRNAGVLS